MKDKPYPITGHAAFYQFRDVPYWDDIRPTKRAKLLRPKRTVKRAKKKL